jgi:hypothetical protein
MLAAALGRAEFRFHCVFNWFNDYVAALRCSKRLWSMVFRLMRCRSARMPLSGRSGRSGRPGRPGQPHRVVRV